MKQSHELTAFYNAYNDWLKNCAIDNIFSCCTGLCHNLAMYCNRHLIDKRILLLEMKNQFLTAGLDIDYPFGRKQYIYRIVNNNSYLDPNRFAWVKAHLTEEVNEKFTPVSKIY